MQFSNTFLLALGLVSGTQAFPSQAARGVIRFLFKFEAAAASYELGVPFDGETIQTNNDLSVNIIDVPSDVNACGLCHFQTVNPATFVCSTTADGQKQIIVGPPTPIISVTCGQK
ncbi:hypothetical protein F4777DRAFT_251925 [Nemania sp. FL0916]|nr:hypothetical protein F4777DRAFT_251925 [Nemania sp. FL0916]